MIQDVIEQKVYPVEVIMNYTQGTVTVVKPAELEILSFNLTYTTSFSKIVEVYVNFDDLSNLLTEKKK